MVIIWTSLVVLGYRMLHSKFHSHQSTGRKYLKDITLFGCGAIMVMWPGQFEPNLFPPTLKDTDEIWLRLAKWLLWRFLNCQITVSPGSKVKEWPWPLLLTNLHVLIKTTLIIIFLPFFYHLNTIFQIKIFRTFHTRGPWWPWNAHLS